MGKWHYYNEFDPFAAEWLRNLIRKGLIPDGEVDTRSIIDVRPDDVREFVQCHYFAGIAGWPLALKFAGWPEDRPVWTGSAPCQPWSVAGKGKGTDDERHLWPAFFHLIRECRPPIVFGEQVASKAGREWLAGVFADLEGVGYAGAGADLCAPGVGAPHIRQRLYWVALADAQNNGRKKRENFERQGGEDKQRRDDDLRGEHLGLGRSVCDMADAHQQRRDGVDALLRPNPAERRTQDIHETAWGGRWHVAGDVANSDDKRPQGFRANDYQAGRERPDIPEARLRNGAGFWDDSEWRRGADGKERRVGCQIRRVPYGIPSVLGPSGNGCREETKEEVNGQESNASPRQDLPDLRDIVQSDEVLQRGIGGLDEVSSQEILQHQLRGRPSECEAAGFPSASEEISGGEVRDMQGDGEPSRSPCRPQSPQQRPVKPSDVVCFLSSQIALGDWQDDAEEAVGLQNLWRACEEVGYVPETLSAFPQVWRSMPDEARQRIGRILCEGGLFWEPIPLLTAKQTNRVGMLRGFGNAIVPQLAAEFIRAAIEFPVVIDRPAGDVCDNGRAT